VIGETVKTFALGGTAGNTVDVSSLPAGVYVCVLHADGKRSQQKIVIQK